MSTDFASAGEAAGSRDRYLGGRPFADTPEDQALFFGRSAEIDSLFNRIVGGHLLVLFGKSGLGKTSLLRAGVFPRLREHGYLPIEVRVGQAAIKRDAQQPGLEASFLEMVAAAAQDVVKYDPSIDYTPGEGETLWEFFKTAMFWRKDELQTPVLMLDQFEEVFTLLEARQREEVAAAIGGACGLMPESVRARRPRGAGGTLSDEPPRLKIVLSLREEYFGTLEQLSKHIPKIFLDRFQLMPLSEKQARDAVIMPAALQSSDEEREAAGEFRVRPFTYSEDALADMLAVLEGNAETVEPFQLQVVCRHVEQIVAAIETTTSEPVIITAKEIGGRPGIQKVIENYYLEQIGKLPRRQRRLARTLCEEGLLTDSGFRLMLEESQIEKSYGLSTEVLGSLVDSRLLRREQRLDSQFYELSHDSLAKAVLAVRPRLRLPRHYKYIAGGIVVVAAAGVVFGVAQWISMKQTLQAQHRAEDVVSFLNREDLQDELRRTGQLDVLLRVQEQVQKNFDPDTDLEKALRRYGRLDLLLRVQQKIQGRFDPSSGSDRVASALRDHALARRNMGELLYESGNTNGAREQFVAAAQILAGATIRAQDGHREVGRDRAEVGRDRAMTWDRLGRVAVDQGNLTEARDFTRRSEAALEALSGHGGEFVDASIAEVAADTGRILFLQGNPREALPSTERAIGTLREVVKARDQHRWHSILVSALSNKAQILAAMGDNQGARQALEEADKAAERLSRADAHSVYSLFRLRHELATVRGTPEDRRRLDVAIQRMLPRLEALCETDPLNARRERDLAVAIGIAARERVMDGRTDEGLRLYRHSAGVLKKLAEQDPLNADWKAELSSVKLGWAQALQSRDPDQARDLYQQSLKLATELVETDRTNVVWSLMLADALSAAIGTDLASQQEQRQRALAIVADLRSRNALPLTWRDQSLELTRSLANPGT